MAAPSTTARSAPAGIQLYDGYAAKIAFSRDPDISIWDKGVTPPEGDGREAIDITSHFNNDVTTKYQRALVDYGDIEVRCAYDPVMYDAIQTNLINQNGSITVHFPDGSTFDCWGYLRTFSPDELTDGTHPEATATIQITNWDDANDVEAKPVFTNVAGT